MARKLARLQRRLGTQDLFGVAYGEIASSIYFALGIIAARALGLTPYVLLATGLLFLVVALSYAEGTTELRETGGGGAVVGPPARDPPRLVPPRGPLLAHPIVPPPARPPPPPPP